MAFFRFASYFIGLSTMSENMNKVCLNEALDAIKRHCNKQEGLSVSGCGELKLEFMVHPGYPTTDTTKAGCGSSGPDEFARSSNRLKELEFLQSKDAFTFMEEVEMLLC